jgi:hypothetical protein
MAMARTTSPKRRPEIPAFCDDFAAECLVPFTFEDAVPAPELPPPSEGDR